MISGLETLIQILSRLPGLGKKSAERLALHLVKKKDLALSPLIEALQETADHIHPCTFCGALDTADPCTFCTSPTRDKKTLCVVQDMHDLLAMERTGVYTGLYHVLGGALSALDGVGPNELTINRLLKRLDEEAFDEVILATNATLDGQTTFHYLKDLIAPKGLKITRLAYGVPLGGELHYLDEGTLTTALNARQTQ